MQVNISSHSTFAPGSATLLEGRIKTLRTMHEVLAVKPVVRWAFYLFVASLPFETIKLGVPVEVTMVTGALFILSTVLQLGLFYRWPSGGFWCFVSYLYICAVMAVLETTHWTEVAWELLVLIQLVIFCWISYCLMRYDQIAKTALFILAGSCAALAALQIVGITAKANDVGAKVERVTALDFNPNDIAGILGIGLLALLGLTYGQDRSILQPRYVAWPIFALVGISIVQTGSRGGLLALGVGMMVFVLRRGTIWSKLRNACCVLLLIGFFAFISLESETTRARFQRTFEEGNLARREEIYPNALQMFQEKPLLGWGNVGYTHELGSRLGHLDEPTKNAHNLILHALASTGILGAIPLFAGIGFAVRGAWQSRRGSQGILPLAMIIAVLSVNMSGLWLYKKLHWLVMAYALASGSRVVARRVGSVTKLPRLFKSMNGPKHVRGCGQKAALLSSSHSECNG
jgi:O-antigen ligase